jgi:phage/plasmid-like protein (TIGR03299 family)
MFYVDKEPWHGLGTKLDRPATAAEAIKAACLDWEVDKKPLVAVERLEPASRQQAAASPEEAEAFRKLRAALHKDVALSIPDRYAVVRQDLWGKPECPVLGIVGRDYTPLQNHEAFEFFDPIVGKDAAIYHTAGALGQGERVWILAKLPSEIRVAGDDITDKFLLLSNSHDGNSSVQIKFTPIRVVCQNTLTMALRHGPTLRVVHMRDVHRRLREADRTLGLINRRFEEIEEEFQELVKVQLNTAKLSEYLGLVFPDPEDEENEKALKRIRTDREWAEYFFVNGKGNQLKSVSGTLWAAYNGVAEYIDHRGTNQTGSDRLESVWFGNGYHVKARAYEVAEGMAAGNGHSR